MDKRTIDAYNIYHEVYDAETVDFWEKFPQNIIDEFIGLLHGRRVLNLGSGPGRDAVILRDKGLEVVCLDGSENMVETTRKMGFESVQGDFRDIDMPENSFDAVWAYSSLFHVTFTEAIGILKQVHRVLKPDGLLFLGLIQGKGNETINIGASKYTRYFEYYDEDKLNILFSESGFTEIKRDTFKPGNQVYLNLLLSKTGINASEELR